MEDITKTLARGINGTWFASDYNNNTYYVRYLNSQNPNGVIGCDTKSIGISPVVILPQEVTFIKRDGIWKVDTSTITQY